MRLGKGGREKVGQGRDGWEKGVGEEGEGIESPS